MSSPGTSGDAADAVISAVGVGTGRTPTEVCSRGMTNVLEALPRGRDVPLVVISATTVGPRGEQPFRERRVAMPLLDRFFGTTYEDMRRMEAILREKGRNWISVRPPRLIERRGTGTYRIATEPLPKSRSIRYPDLAGAPLDLVRREDLYGRAVYVAK